MLEGTKVSSRALQAGDLNISDQQLGQGLKIKAYFRKVSQAKQKYFRATVLPVKIGDGAVIGACALITKDVPPNMMAKGIPAKYYEMDRKEY